VSRTRELDPGVAIPILPARSLEETRRFYERLDFDAAGWWPRQFGGYAILVRGDLQMHFFSAPQLPSTGNDAGCYWRVRDPDRIYAEVKQADLTEWPDVRVVPIEDKPWGTREFALIDPNGNLIRIGAPRPPGAASS
jgi:catechol 2,3-dioxygenase-like lactoylglutathione lyase family enzyme